MTKHLLCLYKPEPCASTKTKTFQTIKITINVKVTNQKRNHKNLLELPDRRVEIKKIR